MNNKISWFAAVSMFVVSLVLWDDHFLARRSIANPSDISTRDAVGNGAQREDRLLTNVRQITFAGARAGEGYFSQDGTLMVFQSEREAANPFFQIYLMDLQTGDTRRISPGYGKTTCAWIHPGKEKVLFASTHEDQQARAKQQGELSLRVSGKTRRYSWDFDEHFDIFEADLSSGQLRNLTGTRGYDAEAAWSPDGKQIVFASNRHAYTDQLSSEDEKALFAQDPSAFVDLYIMDADGTQVRRVTEAKGYDGGPFFSADGKLIIWRRFAADGANAEIFTMAMDGTEQQQITRLGAVSWAPYFHPSGDYIIFTTNVHGMGNFELYLVDSAGRSRPVRVTYTDGFDGLPVFTPDGTRLAWTSNRTTSRQSQIFFAEWNDVEARKLLGLEPKKQGGSADIVSVQFSADQARAGRTVAEINQNELQRHITTLASKEMGGRLTGSEGELRATAYGASIFESLGLQPAGDNGTFFQTFEFTAGVSLGPDNQLVLHTKWDVQTQNYRVDTEWRPLVFSKTGKIEPAAVVFAGYGIVASAEEGFEAYDSYAGLDVTDKWVLVFRYLPEKIAPEFRRHLNRYADLRYKAMLARDRGARGILVVSGPNSKVNEQLVELSFDASLAGTSIAAASVTDAFATQLLKPTGKSLQGLQDMLDTGKPESGFAIPDVTLAATIDIQYEKRIGRNVLARLKAEGASEKEIVVVGAHIDHLGDGIGTGSLARGDAKGKIHYGADDNASGVAGVLEIARYLALQKAQGSLLLRRDLIFALWSGEEIGLLGSSHFTRTFHAIENESNLFPEIVAYLNMDMIGRLNKTLVLQGVSSSSVWVNEIEQHNVPIGLAIALQGDSYLPTDATSFYLKGVPILSAFTGAHEDYHTPGDTADKINYEGAEKTISLMAAITRSLATRQDIPDYQTVEKPNNPIGRVKLRAYLGTIPDYAQNAVVGVKLSGVVKGGPAELAGVQGGDIIIELAGKKIENIYDYTYSVDSLQIGVPINVVVQRGGQPVTLTVTPQSRE